MDNKEKTAVPSVKNPGTVALGKLDGKRAVGLVLNHYQMDNEVTLEKRLRSQDGNVITSHCYRV
ncbi:MAG: hypothetical protein M1294_10375 [Firmicutes bacterium]|nr:hypothetical protein [Bacillota bacterium]MCL5013207.1 hypothetical protein [Bacillota bacterium]